MKQNNPYMEILNAMSDTAWVIGFDGRFLDVNDAAVNILGYPREELMEMGPVDIDGYLSDEAISDLIEEMPSAEEQVFETVHKTKEGRNIPVEIKSTLIRYQGHDAVLSIARDITVRKRAQEELAQQLAEKELFLREVHHRIKNNLNTVESFLELQADNAAGSPSATVLKDAVNRIASIRMIYEKLLQSDDFSTVSVQEYMSELIDTILQTFPERSAIRINKNIHITNLDVQRVFPLGVMINEIITNVMKHSFSGSEAGTMNIDFYEKEGNIILSIHNDGKEFPPELTGDRSGGFGLMIIQVLCRQIGASLSMENRNGPVYTVVIPGSAGNGIMKNS